MCLSRRHEITSGTGVILGELTRSLATAAGGLAGIAAAFGRPPGGGGGGGPEPLKPGMGGGGGGGGGPGIVLYSSDWHYTIFWMLRLENHGVCAVLESCERLSV